VNALRAPPLRGSRPRDVRPQTRTLTLSKGDPPLGARPLPRSRLAASGPKLLVTVAFVPPRHCPDVDKGRPAGFGVQAGALYRPAFWPG